MEFIKEILRCEQLFKVTRNYNECTVKIPEGLLRESSILALLPSFS